MSLQCLFCKLSQLKWLNDSTNIGMTAKRNQKGNLCHKLICTLILSCVILQFYFECIFWSWTLWRFVENKFSFISDPLSYNNFDIHIFMWHSKFQADIQSLLRGTFIYITTQHNFPKFGNIRKTMGYQGQIQS